MRVAQTTDAELGVGGLRVEGRRATYCCAVPDQWCAEHNPRVGVDRKQRVATGKGASAKPALHAARAGFDLNTATDDVVRAKEQM
jgi:hypothetical protein